MAILNERTMQNYQSKYIDLYDQYRPKNKDDKEIIISIDKAVNSSIDLRSKLQLIHAFLETINPDTYHFMSNAFRDGALKNCSALLLR